MKKQKSLFFTAFVSLTAVFFSGCFVAAGTCTRSGNNATLFQDGARSGSATVSGNSLSGILDGHRFSARRVNTASNPFAGTWRGTDEDGESVELVFGDSILMTFHMEDMEWIEESNVVMYDFFDNEAEWEIDDWYDDYAVISGNRMTGTLFETPFTANRVTVANNPFAGTWRGSPDGVRFELVIGEATWAVRTFF